MPNENLIKYLHGQPCQCTDYIPKCPKCFLNMEISKIDSLCYCLNRKCMVDGNVARHRYVDVKKYDPYTCDRCKLIIEYGDDE